MGGHYHVAAANSHFVENEVSLYEFVFKVGPELLPIDNHVRRKKFMMNESIAVAAVLSVNHLRRFRARPRSI